MVRGSALTFETFGLSQAVMSMRDRETGSIWTQLDGKSTDGALQGERLKMMPMPQMTWGDWKSSHPDTLVLSPNTPFSDRYRAVNIGTFNPGEAIYGDNRLDANALVVGVEVGGEFKGYPTAELAWTGGLVNDILAGQPILVVYDDASQTGLAYSTLVEGSPLEFDIAENGSFSVTDRQTGSTWDAQGRATAGELSGHALEFVPSFISEWYGWSAYHPDTDLYAAERGPTLWLDSQRLVRRSRMLGTLHGRRPLNRACQHSRSSTQTTPLAWAC